MEKRYKHPRIKHLPWSPGRSRDDQIMEDVRSFVGQAVVVTEKMDGENTTMYRDGIHARSLTWNRHASRSWVSKLWSEIAWLIPEGLRICGENLYAQHSIRYEDLPSYFLVFSIWEGDECLPWGATKTISRELGLVCVPEICTCPWVALLEHSLRKRDNVPGTEGYVVRLARGFTMDEFPQAVGKWVREDHVQTEEHWMTQPVLPNGLLRKGCNAN